MNNTDLQKLKIERAEKIKMLLDELRKDIFPIDEIKMLRLEFLKRKEISAIKKNTDEAVEEIKKYVFLNKKHIRQYPTLGKQSQYIDGKFVVTDIQNTPAA